MLEECLEVQLAEQFDHLLASRTPEDKAPEELGKDLQIAEKLRNLNLGVESRVQTQLRAQLAVKAGGTQSLRFNFPAFRNRSISNSRAWVGVMAVMLFLFLLSSNTPVRAALERWLGYGYLPYAGFIPLENTLVIQGPVTQSEQAWRLSILQGINNQGATSLWVKTNLPADTFSTAELVLLDGAHSPILSIQSGPETLRLTFDSFPDQPARTDLVIPGGWQLPITWIAADQAGLAPTRVSTPSGNRTAYPCVDLERETQICVKAAFTDLEGTHLLLQASQSGQSIPLSWNATSGWQSIALEGPDGRFYRLEQFEQSQAQDSSVLSMRFTAVSAGEDVVTLHLPVQALSFPGSAIQQPQEINLPLHLPARVPTRSPTPGVVSNSPDHPIAVPTPSTD